MEMEVKTTITKVYDFCSAHWLPKVAETHKCHNIHGHNYKIEITVMTLSGAVPDNGFVVDYWDLDDIIMPLIEIVDHKTLNDVEGLENPTAEVIAAWFMRRVSNKLVDTRLYCSTVKVHETHDSNATVRQGSMLG